MLEEEKRKRARVVRATVNGPLLRWVSKGEEIKVIVEPLQAAGGAASVQIPGYSTYAFGMPPYAGKLNTTSYGQTSYSYLSNVSYHQAAQSNQSMVASSVPLGYPPASTSASLSAGISATSQPQTMGSPQILPRVPPEVQGTELKEKVAKNYVIHERSQYEGVPKPSWNETMEAMFGDHVKWDELKVYVGKGRPLGAFFHVFSMPFGIECGQINAFLLRLSTPETNVPNNR
jgi:vacuolar protein sorting-associated protein 72